MRNIFISGLFFCLLLFVTAFSCADAQIIKAVNATASSVQSPDLSARKAIDGNMKTRWSSLFTDDQWIYFDLGSKSAFNFIEINWETAFGRDYDIKISNDALDWKTVIEVRGGNGGKDEIFLGNRKARYVKIQGIKKGTSFGYSIFEIKIKNIKTPEIPKAPENLKAGLKGDAVVLNWDKDNNATGYNIYRALSSQGPFERINRNFVFFNRFADIDTENKEYYYYVKSFRYFGRESGKSETVSVEVKPGVISEPAGYTGSEIPYYEGLSSNNFGRFGWLTYPWEEAVYTVTPWERPTTADGTLYFLLINNFGIKIGNKEIFLVNRGTPAELSVENVNWVSKTVKLDYGQLTYRITFGLSSPGVLIQSNDNVLTLKIPGIRNSAFVLKSGISVKSGTDLYNAQADGQLKENWILLWDDKAEVPVIIVLKKKPDRIYVSGDRVIVYSNSPFEQAVLAGIYGVDTSQKELVVNGTLKTGTVNKCRFWSKALLAYPVKCTEYFWIEDDKKVGIKNKFYYITITDEWGTKPLRLAPLPPLVSFAKDSGHPVETDDGITGYDFPTWYGPLRGHAGKDTVEYRLEIPPLRHRTYINTDGSEDFRNKLNSFISTSLKYWGGGGDAWALVPDPIWENSPMSKRNLDVYTWMGAFNSPFNSIMFLDDKTRSELLKAAEERIKIPFTKYRKLMPAEVRVEPYTNNVYMVSFWNCMGTPPDKYWDMDEAASCPLQALYCYALYTGDWDTVKKGWKAVKNVAGFLEACNDWAYMASGCKEDGFMSSIDMLNATYSGLLAYSKLAEQAGDDYICKKALYMAVKASIPSVMRLKFYDYAVKYNLNVVENASIAGFSESGPAFHGFPDRFNGYVSMTYFDSARGGSYPELVNLYLLYAKEEAKAWLEKVCKKYPGWYKNEYAIHHIYAMYVLGMEQDKVDFYLKENLSTAMEVWKHDWPGLLHGHSSAPALSGKCPLCLMDWAPAKYEKSFFHKDKNIVELVFDASGTDKLTVLAYSDKKPVKIISKVSGKEDMLAEGAGWEYGPEYGGIRIQLPGRKKTELFIHY